MYQARKDGALREAWVRISLDPRLGLFGFRIKARKQALGSLSVSGEWTQGVATAQGKSQGRGARRQSPLAGTNLLSLIGKMLLRKEMMVAVLGRMLGGKP